MDGLAPEFLRTASFASSLLSASGQNNSATIPSNPPSSPALPISPMARQISPCNIDPSFIIKAIIIFLINSFKAIYRADPNNSKKFHCNGNFCNSGRASFGPPLHGSKVKVFIKLSIGGNINGPVAQVK